MLDVFLPFLADTKVMPIFVVDTKIIFRYNFVASLILIASKGNLRIVSK